MLSGATNTGERQISPFAEVVATCEQNACSRLAARWYCSAGWAHQRTLQHNVPSSNGSELPAGTAKKVPEEAGSRTHNSPREYAPCKSRDAVGGILLKAVPRRSACPYRKIRALPSALRFVNKRNVNKMYECLKHTELALDAIGTWR